MEQNTVSFKEFDTDFLKVQAVLRTITKDAKNPYHKNMYASLESVIVQTIAALNANGFVLFQPTIVIDGQKYVRTIVRHAASSQEMTCDTEIVVVSVKGGEPTAQDHGSGQTYARRYGLMSLLALAPSDHDFQDDDGNAASNVREPPPSKAATKSQEAPGRKLPNIQDIRKTIDAAATVEDLKGICATWKQRIGDAKPLQEELFRLFQARAEELGVKVG
jgi:hypothetical protein